MPHLDDNVNFFIRYTSILALDSSSSTLCSSFRLGLGRVSIVVVEEDSRKHSENINLLVNRERLSTTLSEGSIAGMETPNTNDFLGPTVQLLEMISPFRIEFSFQYLELY